MSRLDHELKQLDDELRRGVISQAEYERAVETAEDDDRQAWLEEAEEAYQAVISAP